MRPGCNQKKRQDQLPAPHWGFGRILRWAREHPASGTRVSLNDAPIEGIYAWGSGLAYLEKGPDRGGKLYVAPDIVRLLMERYGYPFDNEVTRVAMASLYRHCIIENYDKYGRRLVKDLHTMFTGLLDQGEVKGRPGNLEDPVNLSESAWEMTFTYLRSISTQSVVAERITGNERKEEVQRNAFKVFVIDDHVNDESDPISNLPNMLREAGYDVVVENNGDAAASLVWEYAPDAIVLGINFERQDINGIEICQYIRQEDSRIPIILVTAVFTETEDVLKGFEAGADDYVIRPRDNREIVARVRSNLPDELIAVDDDIIVDFNNLQLWIKKSGRWENVHMQRLQFAMLQALIVNAGLIVTHLSLAEKVWDSPVSDGLLAVYASRLRAKIEPDPSSPSHIETIRGVGYRFRGRVYPIPRPSASERQSDSLQISVRRGQRFTWG